jgi:hypothetical protein
MPTTTHTIESVHGEVMLETTVEIGQLLERTESPFTTDLLVDHVNTVLVGVASELTDTIDRQITQIQADPAMQPGEPTSYNQAYLQSGAFGSGVGYRLTTIFNDEIPIAALTQLFDKLNAAVKHEVEEHMLDEKSLSAMALQSILSKVLSGMDEEEVASFISSLSGMSAADAAQAEPAGTQEERVSYGGMYL